MKKLFLMMAAVPFVAFFFAGCGTGVIYEQRVWRPGAILSVSNDTEDNAVVELFIDGGQKPVKILRKTEIWTTRFGSGIWPFYPDSAVGDVVVTARICHNGQCSIISIVKTLYARSRYYSHYHNSVSLVVRGTTQSGYRFEVAESEKQMRRRHGPRYW